MKNLTFLLCALLSSVIVFAQNPSLLVSSQWLKEHAQDPDLVILQVSGLQLDYNKEHIPGARYLWPGWLAPDSPQGNYNAPDPEAASEILRNLGVSNDSRVVIVHVFKDVPQAARMFLTLEHLGMRDRVYFLNGGLEAWKKDGNAVTTEVPVVKKGKFKSKVTGLLVDKEYVVNTLKNGVVIDARPTAVYDGAPTGYPRDGHIAGAKSIYFMEMVDQNSMFKPVDQLQTYFTPVAEKGKEVVAYCYIGQTASVVYMAGRILGYDIKLYDGSMQEWSRIESLPMEKTQKNP